MNEIELTAVKNIVNVTSSGFKLDDLDFKTHIGLTKKELTEVSKKLGKPV